MLEAALISYAVALALMLLVVLVVATIIGIKALIAFVRQRRNIIDTRRGAPPV